MAAFDVMSGIVRWTGAALRLFFTLTNASLLFITLLSHKHSKQQTHSSEEGKEFVLFYLFSVLFFCLNQAVTRSNPQSNDRRSLTLIKGAQLTRGPEVTFIRRLVKVYFSLALNTNTRLPDGTGAVYLQLRCL